MRIRIRIETNADHWAFGVLMSPKDGCAQRTGAHARPKPTSIYISRLYRICSFRACLVTESGATREKELG
jgi:hypothetical protein